MMAASIEACRTVNPEDQNWTASHDGEQPAREETREGQGSAQAGSTQWAATVTQLAQL